MPVQRRTTKVPNKPATPGAPRAVLRQSPKSGANIPAEPDNEAVGTESKSRLHPPESGMRRGGRKGGDEIGTLHRRGWSLSRKFSVFTFAVTALITVLFSSISISSLRENLENEIKNAGVLAVNGLRGWGEKVVTPFKEIRGKTNAEQEFDRILATYQATRMAEDQSVVSKMLDSDQRIKDVAIFTAPRASNDPNRPLVRSAANAQRLTSPPANAELRGDVQIFKGDYGNEVCWYFRAPIERDGKQQYSVVNLILSARQVEAKVSSQLTTMIVFALLLIASGVGLSVALATLITKPINNLVDDINTVSQGDLEHESAVPTQVKDEIGLLAMAFNRMTRNLREARDKERDAERIAGELNTAKAIHAKLMPEKLPQLPGIDVFTAYHCAKEVGGDYYDFIPVGDTEHLSFCVADVSGKGIPGSMVMGTTRTILRMMAVNNLSAASVLSKTNFHVARDIKRGMFVTCMYSILNVRTREMTVASAGHNPMLIWRAATQTIEKVRPNGIALGFDKGPIFDRTVREQKVKLLPGDRVVMYTDGVVEAMNEAREEFTDERFDQFVLENATLPSKDFVRLLVQALEEHKGRAEQHDDITVVTFRLA